MKIRLLSAALLAGLAVTHVASAQEFDDRWYVTGSVGYNIQDDDRRTDDAFGLGLGLGKFISPEWSVEGALNYQNPKFTHNSDLLWSQYGVSLDFRRHFLSEGRNWAPYVLAGLGYQRSEEESVPPSTRELSQREDGNLAADLGAGLQGDFSRRVAVRAELAARFDFDDSSYAAESGIDSAGYPHQQEESYFTDVIASVGVVIPLGPEPTAPVAPPPPPPPAPPA